jgi:uracil-DNA glycosylase
MGMKDFNWHQLDYFQSGEWQVVEERLNDMDRRHELYNPKRELMFASLDATPFDKVEVVVVGQDPYPDRNCACGLAFSVPNGTIPAGVMIPPTLDNIFKEYVNDLHYPYPQRTDLITWANRGVLLWNAIPTCKWQQSMSHDWTEYEPLTKEIVTGLSDRSGIVFVFCGGVARRYVKYVKKEYNTIIETSHPVPRASLNAVHPFTGSRIFTRINDALVTLGRRSIDWKL